EFAQQRNDRVRLARARGAGDERDHAEAVPAWIAKRLSTIQASPETRPPDMIAMASKKPAMASSCATSPAMPPNASFAAWSALPSAELAPTNVTVPTPSDASSRDTRGH